MRIALLAALLLATLPTPAVAQECLAVPGVSERCPSWTFEHTGGDPAADDCDDAATRQVVGTHAIYMTGTSRCDGSGSWDIVTLAVGFDGELLWTARHPGSVYLRHEGFGLAVSPDGGRVYVAGSEDNGEDDDWIVLAYDAATGAPAWVTRYDGPAGDDDQAWAIAASPDGERVYVAGFDRRHRSGGGQDVDIVTASLEASTGAIDWTERFADERGWVDHPRAIGVEGDRVVVTGSSIELLSRQDLVTLAYRDDRDGQRAELLWRDTYDGGDWDQPSVPCLRRRLWLCGLMGTIAVTPDTAAITATSFVDPTTDDAVWTTIAYDLATGERRWLDRHGDPAHQNKANAIAASPDGATIYVTGFENDELLFDGIGDAVTVAYDAATGAQRWLANQALPAVEDAAGFGLHATGETVYVAGAIDYWTTDSFRVDAVVLAYDASTGTRAWIARHNRYASQRAGIGGFDAGNWVDLTPDGTRLIVGGADANTFRIENASDYWDFSILAYDPAKPEVLTR